MKVMKKLNLFLATIAFHGIKRDLTVHLVCAIVEENNFNIQTAQLPYAGGINTNTKYKYKVYKTHSAQFLKLLLLIFFGFSYVHDFAYC